MQLITFIGGGNMASAIIGGLLRSGRPTESLIVVDPGEDQRERLRRELGVSAIAAADHSLQASTLVVWAVKPQVFADAARPCAPYLGSGASKSVDGSSHKALHLSVMAGIRSETIARAVGSDNVVRAMPNTPALIGLGISGLFSRPGVSAEGRSFVDQVMSTTGKTVWVEKEDELDAVTALSGSGPAYVFYFIEAMTDAAVQMGLTAEQGKQLALATFTGATELARQSPEPPSVLRERVTSKGGTTYAALTSLQEDGVQALFIKALQAARRRARELGDEFG